MLFNSIDFLFFFPIVVLIYFILPQKVKNFWLLIASYYFYMSWNAKYGLLLLFCTFITYASSLVVQNIRECSRENEKIKWVLILSLVIIFGILFYYKYTDFMLMNLVRIVEKVGVQVTIPTVDIVLPVGISFFTFQAAGYLIDVYRGDIYAEKNFFRYALFVSFFPQLVAGPIERSKNLLKQLDKAYRFDYERMREGILIMLWGFFQKMVIADRIAIFVDGVFSIHEELSGSIIMAATVLFAFQIYGDFSGYSTIALGAAKILGFDLIDNFNSPYFAVNSQDFWKRWHVSLNTWFVDYVYIPLGGSRKGKFIQNINIMIVFLLSGLWHGAGWHYVVWGGLNGLYQVIRNITLPIRIKMIDIFKINVHTTSHKIIQMISTFIMIDFAWLFFRVSSLSGALGIVHKFIFDFQREAVFSEAIYQYGIEETEFTFLIITLLVLMIVDGMKYKGICVRKWIIKQNWWFRVMVIVGGTLLIAVTGIWGFAYDAQSFIYFQF